MAFFAGVLIFSPYIMPIAEATTNYVEIFRFNVSEKVSGIGIDDSNGDIYVSHKRGDYIDRYDSSGTKYPDSYMTEGSAVGYVENPHDIEIDSSGNKIIADNGNHRIQIHKSSGGYYTIPVKATGIDIDDAGNIYVANYRNEKIQIYDYAGVLQREFNPSNIERPKDVAVDTHGNIYIPDSSGNTIEIFDSNGVSISSVDVGFETRRSHIDVDDNGNIAIVGKHSDTVLIFDSSGNLSSEITGLDRPTALHYDGNNKLYVAEKHSDKILVFEFFDPIDLVATAGISEVELSWTVPNNAITDYIVEYSSDDGATWNTFGTFTATTATVTGLSNGQSYDFRVYSTTAFVTGDSSNVVTSTPFGYVGVFPINEDTDARGITFSSNGTLMFVLGNTNDKVLSYKLDDAFDVSGGAFHDSFQISPSVLIDIEFTPDGKSMFILDSDNITEYSLDNAYDIKSPTPVFTFNVPSIGPRGLEFSNNDQMFIVGNGLDIVYSYDLHLLGVFPSDTYDISSSTIQLTGLAFSSTGKEMFILENNLDIVYSYNLTKSYDISNIPNVSEVIPDDAFSLSNELDTPRGITFSSDGLKMFVSNSNPTDDSIHEYYLPGPYELVP